MHGSENSITILILMTGAILVSTALIKLFFERLNIPAVVGFILFGLGLNLVDSRTGFITADAHATLRFLSGIGIICLLFRAGLECDLQGLISQLRRASLVWAINMAGSGLAGFMTAYWLLGYTLVPSLIVAAALTATSVGISLAVWQQYKATDSDNGRLLLDVAELDDISAVILMAMLFTLIPLLANGRTDQLLSAIAGTGLVFGLKFFGFIALCYYFATLAEHPIVHFFKKFDPPPLPMLTVVGIGFIIAAIAGFLDFSVAIGAFFAGLVFSRDSEAVKLEASFLPLYEFFTPFFFLVIGLDITIGAMEHSIPLVLALFAAAVAGKLIANGIPLWFMKGLPGALLIGTSMVPRAEIAMIVMQKGAQLGENIMPPELFSAMAMVSILTCALAPISVRPMLERWPQNRKTPQP